MVKQIFVNLPVKDLEKTKEFWTKLGFTFNLQFTDEKGAALVLGENIFAMLITEPFYKILLLKKILPILQNFLKLSLQYQSILKNR